MSEVSILQKARAAYKPKLPPALSAGASVKVVVGDATSAAGDLEKIQHLFPKTYGNPLVEFAKGKGTHRGEPVYAGVILSGGQAPGGHNVIAGLHDGLKSLHPESKLFGFKGGPSGLINNDYVELTDEIIDAYRNTGGFDIIGSGRTKLEAESQFDAAKDNCAKLGITALVVIGGDDSNTNACLLAEHYRKNAVPIQVIGCPKTIDGDLKNEQVEVSFGFDTACAVYSELIGNICRDANSAKKYWHFIKLMGRSASHITLECGLQTHTNITLVSEEVAHNKMTLQEIVDDMCEIIAERGNKNDNFGVALVPEGLIEFIPEFKTLIGELNDLLAREADAFNAMRTMDEKFGFVNHRLARDSSYVFSSLPQAIQTQLTMDRDPHGNVQVSLIDTEKLLAEMVEQRLSEMKAEGRYHGKFKAQCHFFGYEGRCAPPSNFDADYCYSLGYNAAAIIGTDRTGYMSAIRDLTKPASEWKACGVPITMMMNVERRHGEDKPVIRKALVDLEGGPFLELVRHRKKWGTGTAYLYPGPIQYFGPSEVCDQASMTLKLERG